MNEPQECRLVCERFIRHRPFVPFPGTSNGTLGTSLFVPSGPSQVTWFAQSSDTETLSVIERLSPACYYSSPSLSLVFTRLRCVAIFISV